MCIKQKRILDNLVYMLSLRIEVKILKKISKEVAFKALQICILVAYNVWKALAEMQDNENE